LNDNPEREPGVRGVALIEIIEEPVEGLKLEQALAKIRDDLGVEHVSFGISAGPGGLMLASTTYGPAWCAHYIKHGYHAIDPVWRTAASSIIGVDWSSLRGREGYSEIFDAARDFSIPVHGTTVPVKGFFGETAILGISAKLPEHEWSRFIREKMPYLQQSAVFLCDRVSFSSSPAAKLMSPRLGADETAVLRRAALGEDISETGRYLSMSDRMVDLFLRSARTKMRALTTPQAVGRAMTMGLVDPF